jgi:hypothetical protein
MTKTGKFSVIYCNTYLIYYTSMKLFKVFFFFAVLQWNSGPLAY